MSGGTYVKAFASLGISAIRFPDTDLYPATNIWGLDLLRRDVPAILDSTRRELASISARGFCCSAFCRGASSRCPKCGAASEIHRDTNSPFDPLSPVNTMRHSCFLCVSGFTSTSISSLSLVRSYQQAAMRIHHQGFNTPRETSSPHVRPGRIFHPVKIVGCAFGGKAVLA